VKNEKLKKTTTSLAVVRNGSTKFQPLPRREKEEEKEVAILHVLAGGGGSEADSSRTLLYSVFFLF
jgi:hypothetical protein